MKHKSGKQEDILLKLESIMLQDVLEFMYLENLSILRFHSDFGIVSLEIKAGWCKTANKTLGDLL